MQMYNPVKSIQRAYLRGQKKGFYLSQTQHLGAKTPKPVIQRAVAMRHKTKMGEL